MNARGFSKHFFREDPACEYHSVSGRPKAREYEEPSYQNSLKNQPIFQFWLFYIFKLLKKISIGLKPHSMLLADGRYFPDAHYKKGFLIYRLEAISSLKCVGYMKYIS